VREFGYGEGVQSAAVVVKHTNPCGVAVGSSLAEALQRALAADSVSAFGGIVALNAVVDGASAERLTSLFLECVVAPGFSDEALARLGTKANLRLLELPAAALLRAPRRQLRTVLGGLLAQDLDDQAVCEDAWQVVSQRPPSSAELDDLRLAWRLVRHVRSNAIVVARAGVSLGIGAGQMNRVGSARLALEAAAEAGQGAVLASDGFFPFGDTVRLAAEYGISALIQPGGSVRDGESIEACDQLGLAMVCTGQRHFLH
jgi:phosphoribosylaminoimidazolecarboxamide formyltransferase / IMP cyclohydrolase